MPDRPISTLRIDRTLLGTVRTADHFVTGVIQSLIEKAKDGEIKITMQNIEGKPFEVLTKPDGTMAWGVGGSSG